MLFRSFPDAFGKFIFVQIGAVDAGTFKGAEELERLKQDTSESVGRYTDYARKFGFEAEGISEVSHDIVGSLEEICAGLLEKNPSGVIFGGQLAFSRETIWTRWLHNYAVFALQRAFCRRGQPFVIVPARV